MKIELEIDDEKIRGLLCNAFEGGSNHWYRIASYDINQHATLADVDPAAQRRWAPCQVVPLVEGCAVMLYDRLGEARGHAKRLDRKAIERGILVMKAEHPRHFGDWLAERDDATTGDVFLQCCVFGDVIYG